MPKNNNLNPVKLPMDQKWNEKPSTDFKNNLDSIGVFLIDSPTVEQLREYMPQFLEATWNEAPKGEYLSVKDKDEIIRSCFEGKSLPTALETIGLTFRIEGISIQEVTHLLRYRGASFSADCSGDKWWTHRAALVPNSIQNSHGYRNVESSYDIHEDFYRRYKNIVKMSKRLYQEMIDSKKISIMDARYILPRCLETFYFMRINMKDAISFINQRIDQAIQPETDNVIAYQMALEVLENIPYAYDLFDFKKESKFFTKMSRTGKSTNLYFPNKQNDTFEWNEKDFIYQNTREEMHGTNEDSFSYFEIVFDMYVENLDYLNKKAKEFFKNEHKCYL